MNYITQETLDGIVSKYETKIEQLEYQVEQRDKTIKNAHALLTLESKRLA